MLDCMVVGLGGFIGSVGRFLLGKVPIKNPTVFPINTFLINVLGAFLIGCIVVLATKDRNLDPKLVLFLQTGICGGFTTYSTFSLEATRLIQSGAHGTAMAYIVLSGVLGIVAVFAAQYVVK